MIYDVTVCFRHSNLEIRLNIQIYSSPHFFIEKGRILSSCPSRFRFRTSPYCLMVVLLPSWGNNKCRALGGKKGGGRASKPPSPTFINAFELSKIVLLMCHYIAWRSKHITHSVHKIPKKFTKILIFSDLCVSCCVSQACPTYSKLVITRFVWGRGTRAQPCQFINAFELYKIVWLVGTDVPIRVAFNSHCISGVTERKLNSEELSKPFP